MGKNCEPKISKLLRQMNFVDLNNYEKMDLIGQGGFGAVFKIRNKKTGELFAAKISFKYYDFSNEKESLYIQREVNALAALNHPAILKFEGFSQRDFHNESKPVIVMEYAENNSVDHQIHLEQQSLAGPWDDTRKLICIYGIASGMKYLHSNKMLHRDLKPENILLTDQLFPKIADFGLAKQIHTNQDSRTLDSEAGFKGTPNYSAPEIFVSNTYSKASDVFAFGMTVYAIMTATIPYSNNLNTPQIRKKIINNEKPTFSGFLISPEYKALIEQCWTQDPEERPSFESIVDALETNPDFITETIDTDEYFTYVDYVKEYSTTFDPSKRLQLTQTFLKKSQNKSSKAGRKDQRKSAKVSETDEPNNQSKTIEKVTGNPLEGKSQEEKCKYYKSAADKGNIDAMYNYANMLNTGDGIEMNKKVACQYFKMAADKEQIDAMYSYAHILYSGEGVEVNKEEACRYFKMAAEKGQIDSMYNYANMLYSGEGVEMNKKEASRYFKMAADKGQIKAMYNYAHMLYSGEGVELNKEEACRYFKMASEKGQIDAVYNYALMLRKGEGTEMNKEEACRYFKMAADKGQVNAMYNYALMLSSGEGTEMNKEEACRYFKMAADKGQINAMYNYAVMLSSGEGTEMNKEMASRYFKMAADKGQINAMYNYALMLSSGEGTEMNKEEACRYFKMAADKGQINAMYDYALRLKNGEGVTANKEEASRYFKLSADKGNSKAMYDYGIMLQNGDGIQMNRKQSYQYFKLAAENGDTRAMNSYGLMLQKGNGVQMNKADARRYFKKAADNGDVDAMYNYAKMLQPDNFGAINEEARHYYKMAADAGHHDAIVEYSIIEMSHETPEDEIEQDEIKLNQIVQPYTSPPKSGHSTTCFLL